MTNSIIHAHIRVAAKSFERGESFCHAETPAGDTVTLFHRKLWRLARKFGYDWRMKKDGLRIEIKQKESK